MSDVLMQKVRSLMSGSKSWSLSISWLIVDDSADRSSKSSHEGSGLHLRALPNEQFILKEVARLLSE